MFAWASWTLIFASSMNIEMNSSSSAMFGRMRLMATSRSKPPAPNVFPRHTSAMPPMLMRSRRRYFPNGKYLLLDRINIGGMAEVWRGKTFGAGGFERLVAIKRILPNIAEDDEFISMFIDEAKISVQLAHANIAQIYELGHISNSYFIAMEYIPGKDMRAIFERCRKKGEPAPIPLSCYVIS